MSSRRHIQKRDSTQSSFTPVTNPFKTRGFGNGLQAREAKIPETNLLQKRPVASPFQPLSQEPDTRSIEEQMAGANQFGYDIKDIPVEPPSTPPPPPPVQMKERGVSGWEQPSIQAIDPVMNGLNLWRKEQLAEPETGELEQEPKKQTKLGRTLYAQTGRLPSEDLDQYCFDLLQKIKELYKEVKFRYEDLLRDKHNLYRNHYSIDQPHPDYGSWEGHQDRYDRKRAELQKFLTLWDDHCKGDPDLVTYAQADIEDAENYAEIPAPERPLKSERGFKLPDWAIALGVVVVGGAIIIGATLTLPGWALAALASIAAVAGLRLIDKRI
ncbi:MAG TPA: hypothetical protein DCL61_25100 [Cyanobacteria bacterium UBA12227]|nr:hypothetical protein [Cyanobacteria bacterium UBA12227]HAX87547.1 hypothetical protein [Cyanobacteria bacterium UBA11370]HBY76746.1 hypothetical protein [Cyanobacteria bacterium UBA11148]